MKRMIFATGNENKMKEIREILGALPLEILSMKGYHGFKCTDGYSGV